MRKHEIASKYFGYDCSYLFWVIYAKSHPHSHPLEPHQLIEQFWFKIYLSLLLIINFDTLTDGVALFPFILCFPTPPILHIAYVFQHLPYNKAEQIPSPPLITIWTPRNIKGALPGLKQFLAIKNHSKMMKKAFYFTSKTLFVLKIFKFLSWLFGHVSKGLD